jgi:hypothetical protein
MKLRFELFCAKQYIRHKRRNFNLCRIIDLTFGEDYCMMCWLEHKIGQI